MLRNGLYLKEKRSSCARPGGLDFVRPSVLSASSLSFLGLAFIRRFARARPPDFAGSFGGSRRIIRRISQFIRRISQVLFGGFHRFIRQISQVLSGGFQIDKAQPPDFSDSFSRFILRIYPSDFADSFGRFIRRISRI